MKSDELEGCDGKPIQFNDFKFGWASLTWQGLISDPYQFSQGLLWSNFFGSVCKWDDKPVEQLLVVSKFKAILFGGGRAVNQFYLLDI